MRHLMTKLVASNDRKIWEKETMIITKTWFHQSNRFFNSEAAEVDPSITQLPAHKLRTRR